MKNKEVLITGGSRNIGLSISKELNNQGYRVINLDILPPQEEIAEFYQVDLSNIQQTGKVLDQINKNHSITSFIHCAGILRVNPIEKITYEDFQQTMDINIWPYIQISQSLIPFMKKNSYGRIIAIASRAVLGIKEESVYAASKSALIALTKCWALELASFGITCNSIAPGPIDTIMTNTIYPEKSLDRENYIKKIPLGRFGKEEDVANAVSYFMNSKSSFITGQTLYICGGLTIGKTTL